ncbi:MAG TPA: hypothetical protein ENI37_03265 [Chloroflexi bacterium]|nr:hypothetical protein [Chloroflexota bacterium]
MAVCWVKAGECGQETSIEARKVSPIRIAFEITTTCEHIQALADELGEVNVGHEMSCSLNETQVYTIATKHVCRNSCIVPAAILKAMEVTAGIFLPGDCQIEFVEGAV